MKLSKEMNCYPVVIQDRAVRQVLTAKAFELEQENEQLKTKLTQIRNKHALLIGLSNELANDLLHDIEALLNGVSR